MPRLDWVNVGQRFYEAGVDRGVLYIANAPGVAWSGLTAVRESHSGGETKAYFIDGVKYLERQTFEHFQATIEAFTYPEEFDECNGTRQLSNGLFATRQRRRPFGFSYRTRVGNDINGLDHGYKLHIVYNALASPMDQEHTTLSDSIEPFNFSWEITTKAPVLDFRPTAHFVIDSRKTPQGLLSYVEDILYGTEDNLPRLPDAGELAHLFITFENPEFDAGDPNDIAYYTYDGGGPTSTMTEEFDAGGP
jgi:hypothetical protein